MNKFCTLLNTILLLTLSAPAIKACVPPTLTVKTDTVLSSPSVVTLYASGADYYLWSPGALLSDSTSGTVTTKAALSQTTAFTVKGYKKNPETNLVTNGDFELGNTGFTSKLTYNRNEIGKLSSPSYAFTTDSKNWGYSSTIPHNGQYMCLYTGSNKQNAWINENVDIEKNTWYVFSFRACNLTTGNSTQRKINFSINSSTVATTPALTSEWNEYYVYWYSGSNESATFAIQIVTSGGLLALDDVCIMPLEDCYSEAIVNVFVPKITTETVNDCESSSYSWHGKTFTESGIYTDTIKSVLNGYDSVYARLHLQLGVKNLTIRPDTTIIAGASCNLWANGATYYQWSPNTTLSNSTIQKPTATPTTNATYIVRGYGDNILGDNLIKNGDFELGNDKSFKGFGGTTVTATYSSGSPGKYNVVENSNDWGLTSNVKGSGGSGQYMIIYGKSSNKVKTWECSAAITVAENTWYTFSFDVVSLDTPSDAADSLINDPVQLYVTNGGSSNIISDMIFASDKAFKWERVSILWYSDNNTSITPQIYHYNQKKLFGIDNIELKPLVSCYAEKQVTVHVAQKIDSTVCYSGTPIVWHGIECPTDGDYHYSSADADTIMHLTYKYPSTSTTTMVIHTGESFKWMGKTFNKTIDTTATTVNAVGCDSVATLHLKLTDANINDTTIISCGGDPISWRESTYDTAGDYMDTVKSTTNGSDSIIYVMHLVHTALPDLQVSPDTIIEVGDSCKLWATGIDFCTWSPGATLSDSTSLTPIASPTETTLYTARGYYRNTVDSNLVYNGDFELGNVGFTSEFTYNNTHPSKGYATYGVAAKESDWGFKGKTIGYGGTGKYFIADGATTANAVVWEETVDVKPNTWYSFSAAVASVNNSISNKQYAKLQFSVNDSQVGPIMNSPDKDYQWEIFYDMWYSGSATQATLKIINQNKNADGNDFGLDHIEFKPLNLCYVEKQVLVKINTIEPAEYFSISADDSVRFSPGNLQYQASTATYRFAEHQYDYVGEATTGNVAENGTPCNNLSISLSYDGWIDLFGWGTGNEPTRSSKVASDYPTFVDWGNYPILNGENVDPAYTWRTLTTEEYEYMINSRKNANLLRGYAVVNGVNGMILLPNMWQQPSAVTFTPNTGGYTANVYDLSQWATMEEAGAVFLPAAGFRKYTDRWVMESTTEGHYWTASPTLPLNGQDAICRNFWGGGSKFIQNVGRHNGLAVRLVTNSECKVNVCVYTNIGVTTATVTKVEE